MPSSPHSSSDSPPSSATPSADGEALPKVEWRLNAALFLATIVSVFVTQLPSKVWSEGPTIGELQEAGMFAGTLLTILLAHELGHYIAARLHKVDATLPFFIPLPILSPFGTMGAVIRMRSVIPTRKALLDIGAAGPLAGLVFAIPLYVWGVAHSTLVPISLEGGQVELGDSLLALFIDRLVGPEVPTGMDIALSPVAYAAWAGMFVTMINLLPVGQLDAGHVAYALFGKRQNKFAMIVHRMVLAFFFVSLGSYVMRDLRAGLGFARIGQHAMSAMFWFVWFEVLAVLGTISQRALPERERTASDRMLPARTRLVAVLGLALLGGLLREFAAPPFAWIAWFVSLGLLLAMEAKWGALRQNTLLDHPPTAPEPLGLGRKIIAIVTLLFFALLFMRTPFSL